MTCHYAHRCFLGAYGHLPVKSCNLNVRSSHTPRYIKMSGISPQVITIALRQPCPGIVFQDFDVPYSVNRLSTIWGRNRGLDHLKMACRLCFGRLLSVREGTLLHFFSFAILDILFPLWRVVSCIDAFWYFLNKMLVMWLYHFHCVLVYVEHSHFLIGNLYICSIRKRPWE